MGHAAGQSLPRRQVRRRLLDVVRQGPRRRPLGRCAQARQFRRLVEARRRACAGRRRPRLQILDARAPIGTYFQGLRPAGAVSIERSGIPRLRPARLGDEPIFGSLGRNEMRDRCRRIVGIGRHRSASHANHHSDRLRDARGRPQHSLARPAPRARGAAARLQVVRGARLCARQQARSHRDRFARRPLRHHHRRQSLSGRAAGARRPRSRR